MPSVIVLVGVGGIFEEVIRSLRQMPYKRDPTGFPSLYHLLLKACNPDHAVTLRVDLQPPER